MQQRIVADERERSNVLVLAGPGSGKTRVLVHRIAYLVRVLRERPAGILALAYNRHAAMEIRRRLRQLIGDDSRGVTVLTCHGLAMRLTSLRGVNPFLAGLSANEPAFCRRPATALAPPPSRHYLRLTMADVHLGFGGHYPAGHPLHRAVAELTTGDRILLRQGGERRELVDAQGRLVGRLARGFSLPPDMRCIEARVVAIMVRRREDEGSEFQEGVCCEQWELVLPELIVAPNKERHP